MERRRPKSRKKKAAADASAEPSDEQLVAILHVRGESVGMIKVRLFRPFDPAYLLGALPVTAKKVAVLDRCKEPGADGEPLYKDVLGALVQRKLLEIRYHGRSKPEGRA